MTLYRATEKGNVPMSAEEEAEFYASQAPRQPTVDETNEVLKAKLREIDAKSIRALRENDRERIDALDQQAAAIRAGIIE